VPPAAGVDVGLDAFVTAEAESVDAGADAAPDAFALVLGPEARAGAAGIPNPAGEFGTSAAGAPWAVVAARADATAGAGVAAGADAAD
jgi:hypothetical protein